MFTTYRLLGTLALRHPACDGPLVDVIDHGLGDDGAVDDSGDSPALRVLVGSLDLWKITVMTDTRLEL